MQQTAAIDPEYGTTDKEGPMVNQPRNPAREPCETGKRGEDEHSVEIELPVEPALFVGLFIVFFIAILAFLTIQNVNDPTKTLPDMIRSFINYKHSQRHPNSHRTIPDGSCDMEDLQARWKPDPQTTCQTLCQRTQQLRTETSKEIPGPAPNGLGCRLVPDDDGRPR